MKTPELSFPLPRGWRQQEIEAQHEILKLLRGIEEQPDTSAILLRDNGAAESGEKSAADHLPVRELRVAAVEETGEAGVRRPQGRIRHQMRAQPAREGDAGEHRVRRPDGGEERGAGDVGVGDIVKETVGIGHRLIGIVAHS